MWPSASSQMLVTRLDGIPSLFVKRSERIKSLADAPIRSPERKKTQRVVCSFIVAYFNVGYPESLALFKQLLIYCKGKSFHSIMQRLSPFFLQIYCIFLLIWPFFPLNREKILLIARRKEYFLPSPPSTSSLFAPFLSLLKGRSSVGGQLSSCHRSTGTADDAKKNRKDANLTPPFP